MPVTGRCVQGARFTSWDLDDLDDDDYLNFDEALEWAGAEDDVVEVEVDEADDVEEVAEEVADDYDHTVADEGDADDAAAEEPEAADEADGPAEAEPHRRPFENPAEAGAWGYADMDWCPGAKEVPAAEVDPVDKRLRALVVTGAQEGGTELLREVLSGHPGAVVGKARCGLAVARNVHA